MLFGGEAQRRFIVGCLYRQFAENSDTYYDILVVRIGLEIRSETGGFYYFFTSTSSRKCNTLIGMER